VILTINVELIVATNIIMYLLIEINKNVIFKFQISAIIYFFDVKLYQIHVHR